MEKIVEKIIRVVLYIRVSREEQARWGYSLDAQKERLIEYCKEMGYKIVEIYIDAGKTARTKLHRRKELMKLLDDAKENKFDRIIVWKLDRWIRSVADYYKIQEVLDEHNITWECSDEKYETNTANGRYQLNNKLNDNQNESDKTSERIKFINGIMVKNKKPLYGSQCLPMGLIVVGEKRNKSVIIDKEFEPIAYDMLDNFEMTGSIRKTLNYINDKYDLKIHYDSLRKWFRNTLLYGCYRGIEDYCEAYITKERFDNIQSLIKCNNKDNKKQYDYIFTGLIRCYECGNSMIGGTHKSKRKNKNGKEKVYKFPYYRCGKHCSSKLCSNSKSINQNVLEKWLINNFEDELKNHIVELQSLKDDSINNSKIKLNEKNIEKLLAKINRLNELYIDGKISKEKYETDYSKYNDELTSLKNFKQEERNLSKYENLLGTFTGLELYNKLDDSHKNLFWKKYIDHIEQDKESLYKIFFK